MAISESDLRLEIGKEAYDLLEADDIASICVKAADVTYGGLLAFRLLMRNFQPSYKMGRMYVAESERYSTYRQLYIQYAQQVRAGASTAFSDAESDAVPDFG